MENHRHCFGCDGEFDVDDGIASFRRSSFCDLVDDPDVSSEDMYILTAVRTIVAADYH